MLIMTNPTEQFRAATRFLLDQKSSFSQKGMAEASDRSPTYVSDFMKGRAPGAEDARVSWARYFGYSYVEMLTLGDQILKGNNPEEWIEDKDTNISGLPHSLPDFTAVPKYKARLSGGPGSLEDSDQIEANMMFRTEFLKKKGPVNKMALFEVSGDSMVPFIHHGDVVLVDRSHDTSKQIVDGKAYAFQENGTVKVKRLSRQGDKIIASSDNHMMHPPYHVDLDMFHLIGKVIWVGHEVK